MAETALSIRERARRRALRAAQVVTMSACLAGCGLSHGRGDDAGSGDDAGPPIADAGTFADAGLPGRDAGPPARDAGPPPTPDAGPCTYELANTSRECCEELYGSWQEGVGCLLVVEGPRVPPSMTV
ncbi:MAG: hypothetical protein AB7S26_02230 [Sandaracinaceae bacterium]